MVGWTCEKQTATQFEYIYNFNDMINHLLLLTLTPMATIRCLGAFSKHREHLSMAAETFLCSGKLQTYGTQTQVRLCARTELKYTLVHSLRARTICRIQFSTDKTETVKSAFLCQASGTSRPITVKVHTTHVPHSPMTACSLSRCCFMLSDCWLAARSTNMSSTCQSSVALSARWRHTKQTS